MEITIQGIEQLRRKLKSNENFFDVLEPPMQRSVLRLEARMKEYPPERPGQKYVRTGTLGRRWKPDVTRTSGELRGVVGNKTIYAPLVQSARFQRPAFRGRWDTDEIVMESEKAAIVRDFERAVAGAL